MALRKSFLLTVNPEIAGGIWSCSDIIQMIFSGYINNGVPTSKSRAIRVVPHSLSSFLKVYFPAFLILDQRKKAGRNAGLSNIVALNLLFAFVHVFNILL